MLVLTPNHAEDINCAFLCDKLYLNKSYSGLDATSSSACLAESKYIKRAAILDLKVENRSISLKISELFLSTTNHAETQTCATNHRKTYLRFHVGGNFVCC